MMQSFWRVQRREEQELFLEEITQRLLEQAVLPQILKAKK